MATPLYSTAEEGLYVTLPPKVPMATLCARLGGGLDKLSKQEPEEKLRRCEAFQEERGNDSISKNDSWTLPISSSPPPSSSACWQPSLNAKPPPTTLKVSCSSSGSSSQGSISFTGEPKDTVPEHERIRRRKVELELIELSNKLREEQLRKERMVSLTWDKATFDPFSSSSDVTTDAEDGGNVPSSTMRSRLQDGEGPNPRKRGKQEEEEEEADPSSSTMKPKFRNLFAIGVPPQAKEYYTRNYDSHRRGEFLGFGCNWNPDPEDVERLVAFANKWIPTDPKRRKMMEEEKDGS